MLTKNSIEFLVPFVVLLFKHSDLPKSIPEARLAQLVPWRAAKTASADAEKARKRAPRTSLR